jgi:hypothetical protein
MYFRDFPKQKKSTDQEAGEKVNTSHTSL